MKRFLVVALSLFGLAACQAGPPRPVADNPYYRIPAGTRLVLNRAVDIPAHKAAVYFQDGKRVSPYFGIDKYRPSCKFEMWNILAQPRSITPDTFNVTRVVLNEQYVREGRPGGVRPVGFRLGERDDGGPFAAIENTVLYLHSARQPKVYRLTCSEWDDITRARHLTVNQIRTALGEVFTLQLPKR